MPDARRWRRSTRQRRPRHSPRTRGDACCRAKAPMSRHARAAHHRRRHRGLQVARPHPPAAGQGRDGALHSHRGRAGIHHAARRRRAVGRPGVHRPVRSAKRVRRRPYPARARHRSGRRGARDRRPDGQDGGRPCRRSRHRRAARDRQADPDRARDEPGDVGAPGDAAQSRAAHRGRRRGDRPERRRDGGARRGRHRPHGGAAGDRGGGRGRCWRTRQANGRSPASASSSRRGRRTSRSIRCATSPTARRANRATPSQQQQQQQAPRSCWCRDRSTCRIPPASRSCTSRPRARCSPPSRRRCRRIARSSPPRSPTGACGETDREKIKKAKGRTPSLALIENPDILATIAQRKARAAAARHRLCGRDRERRRQRQGQAQAQGLRLDRRQRRVAGDRHHGRRLQQRASGEGRWRGSLAAANRRTTVARALVERIAMELSGDRR